MAGNCTEVQGSAEAVLKLTVDAALACRDWNLFRNSGTKMQGGEPSGTGVGIKVGIDCSDELLPLAMSTRSFSAAPGVR
jgi:hypothetical protein